MSIDIKNKKYECANGDKIVSLVKVTPEPSDGYIYLGLIFDGEDYFPLRWDIKGVEENYSTAYNLVEVNPWKDVPVDTKCYVWDKCSNIKAKRHFAGLDSMGSPRFFSQGKTSWSTDNTYNYWNFSEIAKDV